MDSFWLANNDRQGYKDKTQYCIIKVTITFVNNLTFISDLCRSWMAWTSKNYLWLR